MKLNKHEAKITKQWLQDRLYEQNGYYPRQSDITILSWGGYYDDVHIFHPVNIACRVAHMRYDFFNNKLIEKVDCSHPAEEGFELFMNYVEGKDD